MSSSIAEYMMSAMLRAISSSRSSAVRYRAFRGSPMSTDRSGLSPSHLLMARDHLLVLPRSAYVSLRQSKAGAHYGGGVDHPPVCCRGCGGHREMSKITPHELLPGTAAP